MPTSPVASAGIYFICQLNVFNRTRSVAREEKNLANFLKAGPEKWVENSFEVNIYINFIKCNYTVFQCHLLPETKTIILSKEIILKYTFVCIYFMYLIYHELQISYFVFHYSSPSAVYDLY